MLKLDTDGSHIVIKDGKVISRQISTYNYYGEFLEWISYDDNGSIKEIRTWQFNRNKQITEWGYLNPDRTVNYILTARYDEAGNQLEYVARDHREVFEYNKSNQPVARHFYDKDRSLQFTQIFEYDGSGNKILEKTIGKDGEFSHTYKYDSNNLLIEESNGVLHYKTVYTYDTGNRLINEITYDQLGNIISNCFYDEDGEMMAAAP